MSDPNLTNPVDRVDPANPANRAPATKGKDPWFYVSVWQNITLGILGLFFAGVLVVGILGGGGKNMVRLANPEIARGVITYLVAVATMGIAMILAMAAIMKGGSDLDKRFAFGKEVLTLLIGVLGTIIGFYYGSAAKSGEEKSQPLAVASVEIEPAEPIVGQEFTLSANISGGTAPYIYTIRFSPDVVKPAVQDETSEDGKITHKLLVSGPQAQPIDFQIDVTDSENKTYTYNQDNAQKITMKGATTQSP